MSLITVLFSVHMVQREFCLNSLPITFIRIDSIFLPVVFIIGFLTAC